MAEITIRHTHTDGTLIEGSRRGDGVWEILRPGGFKYFRSISQIGIPQSRDHVAKRWMIQAAADALRAAGHEVTVEIDDTPRARADVLADQAERLDGRRDALAAKAVRVAGEVESLWQRSDQLTEHIPPGQPILVGHHSERGHRRTLERAQNLAFAAVAKGREAREVAQRAEVVGDAAKYAASIPATLRRIERAQAELRGIDRNLEGYERRSLNGRDEVVYVERHEAASGAYRETLEARRAQLVGQITYDEQAVEQAKVAGFRTFAKADFTPGCLIKARGRWHKVVKVNRTTVDVETGYSWTDKVKFIEVRDVRTPNGKEG